MGGYNGALSPACDTTFTEMYNYGAPGAQVSKQLTVTRGSASFNLAAGYSNDSEGRTTNETYPTDANGATASLSYTFDSMGRLNGMTDNFGARLYYGQCLYKGQMVRCGAGAGVRYRG